MIKPVKMEKGSKDCIACVAAMATGTSLEEFKSEVERGENGYFDTKDFLIYLMKRGYHAGQAFIFSKAMQFDLAPHDCIINVQLNTKTPAMLRVLSRDKKGYHAIYWDGSQVYDPDPDILNPKLSDYFLLAWHPISKTNQSEIFPAKIFPKPASKRNRNVHLIG